MIKHPHYIAVAEWGGAGNTCCGAPVDTTKFGHRGVTECQIWHPDFHPPGEQTAFLHGQVGGVFCVETFLFAQLSECFLLAGGEEEEGGVLGAGEAVKRRFACVLSQIRDCGGVS